MYISQDQGVIAVRDSIQSSIGPFYAFMEHRIVYPESVVQALGDLYKEYNHAFLPLVRANREWETDYRFCLSEGSPVNYGVQIDMVGLSRDLLNQFASMDKDAVREALRRRIFEIENSLAMYQLLENLFAREGEVSFFKQGFRRALNGIRERFGRPIALLAVTKEKYQAMKESEFGKLNGSVVTDAEVQALCGFDRFFGPEEFESYMWGNGGRCEYLLYARTSDPIEKLKNPDILVDHPILSEPSLRRVIKEHSLTFNIDDPDMEIASRINDTKGYMAPMGLAHLIHTEEELYSPEFRAHLSQGGRYLEFSLEASRLSESFCEFLREFGVHPGSVEEGEKALRFKPAKGTFGCYGHLSGSLFDRKLRGELRRNLVRRPGGYVVQPEMEIPRMINEAHGNEYAYIDRNFMAMVDNTPTFIGGFRSFLPTDCIEVRKGRNHGNRNTVWAEIIS